MNCFWDMANPKGHEFWKTDWFYWGLALENWLYFRLGFELGLLGGGKPGHSIIISAYPERTEEQDFMGNVEKHFRASMIALRQFVFSYLELPQPLQASPGWAQHPPTTTHFPTPKGIVLRNLPSTLCRHFLTLRLQPKKEVAKGVFDIQSSLCILVDWSKEYCLLVYIKLIKVVDTWLLNWQRWQLEVLSWWNYTENHYIPPAAPEIWSY